MTITDSISIVRQYGIIYKDISINSDVFEDNIARFILENNGKTIWLTESAFQIKIEVHLKNQGDVNTCLISKIDNSILKVYFANDDLRISNIITVQEFIDAMELDFLDIKQAFLKKIGKSFIHSLNNLIPENIVSGNYFLGNPYYFNYQTENERSKFNDQTINYRKYKYDWEINKLKYLLKNKKEYLRFLPTIDELNKIGIVSIIEVKEVIENLNEFKYYLKSLEENLKIAFFLDIENDLLFIQFIEK